MANLHRGSEIISPEQEARMRHLRMGSNIMSSRNDNSSDGVSDARSPSQRTARKDPNEEFFLMTLLSYKLTHREIEKILNVRKYTFVTLLG